MLVFVIFTVCKEKLGAAERAKKIHEGWLKQTQELAEEGNKIEILEQISEEEYEKSKGIKIGSNNLAKRNYYKIIIMSMRIFFICTHHISCKNHRDY